MAWRLAKSLVTLRQQIDGAYPKRSRRSDGTVGDLAHSKRKSDHNPNSAGVVTAIDITHDPRNGFNSEKFAEHLRSMRDPRIKYVISNRKIFSSTTSPWQWRRYNGSNPHSAHCHISVSSAKGLYDSQALWQIRAVPKVAGFISSPELDGEEPDPDQLQDFPEPDCRCWWEEVSDKGEEDNGSNDTREFPEGQEP